MRANIEVEKAAYFSRNSKVEKDFTSYKSRAFEARISQQSNRTSGKDPVGPHDRQPSPWKSWTKEIEEPDKITKLLNTIREARFVSGMASVHWGSTSVKRNGIIVLDNAIYVRTAIKHSMI